MSTNASSEQARAALRREHSVRLVTSDQEGSAVSDLPVGTYGFTSSPALASPLFAVRRYRNFEVHHLGSGPAVIGFVTPADAARLADVATEAPVIDLYPEIDGDATVIVSIGYDRIVHHRQYLVRDSAAISLRIAPTAPHLQSA